MDGADGVGDRLAGGRDLSQISASCRRFFAPQPDPVWGSKWARARAELGISIELVRPTHDDHGTALDRPACSRPQGSQSGVEPVTRREYFPSLHVRELEQEDHTGRTGENRQPGITHLHDVATAIIRAAPPEARHDWAEFAWVRPSSPNPLGLGGVANPIRMRRELGSVADG